MLNRHLLYSKKYRMDYGNLAFSFEICNAVQRSVMCWFSFYVRNVFRFEALLQEVFLYESYQH